MKTIDAKKCKCGRKLLGSEDGIHLYCPACKEYYTKLDHDGEMIKAAEGKFGA